MYGDEDTKYKPRRRTASAERAGALSPTSGDSGDMVPDIITIDDFPPGIPQEDVVRAILSGTGPEPAERLQAGQGSWSLAGGNMARQRGGGVTNSRNDCQTRGSCGSDGTLGCGSFSRNQMLKDTDNWYSMMNWQLSKEQKNRAGTGLTMNENFNRASKRKIFPEPTAYVQKELESHPRRHRSHAINVSPVTHSVYMHHKRILPSSSAQKQDQIVQNFQNCVLGSAQVLPPKMLWNAPSQCSQNIIIQRPKQVTFTQAPKQSRRVGTARNPIAIAHSDLTQRWEQLNRLGNSNQHNALQPPPFLKGSGNIPSNTLSMVSRSQFNMPPQRTCNWNLQNLNSNTQNSIYSNKGKAQGNTKPNLSRMASRGPGAGTFSSPYIILDDLPPVRSHRLDQKTIGKVNKPSSNLYQHNVVNRSPPHLVMAHQPEHITPRNVGYQTNPSSGLTLQDMMNQSHSSNRIYNTTGGNVDKFFPQTRGNVNRSFPQYGDSVFYPSAPMMKQFQLPSHQTRNRNTAHRSQEIKQERYNEPQAIKHEQDDELPDIYCPSPLKAKRKSDLHITSPNPQQTHTQNAMSQIIHSARWQQKRRHPACYPDAGHPSRLHESLPAVTSTKRCCYSRVPLDQKPQKYARPMGSVVTPNSEETDDGSISIVIDD